MRYRLLFLTTLLLITCGLASAQNCEEMLPTIWHDEENSDSGQRFSSFIETHKLDSLQQIDQFAQQNSGAVQAGFALAILDIAEKNGWDTSTYNSHTVSQLNIFDQTGRIDSVALATINKKSGSPLAVQVYAICKNNEHVAIDIKGDSTENPMIVVTYHRKDPNYPQRVTGHADSSGPAGLKLQQARRGESLKNFSIDDGSSRELAISRTDIRKQAVLFVGIHNMKDGSRSIILPDVPTEITASTTQQRFVQATAGWVDTGIALQPGDVIHVEADPNSTWSIHVEPNNPAADYLFVGSCGMAWTDLIARDNRFSTAEARNNFPLPAANPGALLARIGQTGAATTICPMADLTAQKEGDHLWLGINDTSNISPGLMDNQGTMGVIVMRSVKQKL